MISTSQFSLWSLCGLRLVKSIDNVDSTFYTKFTTNFVKIIHDNKERLLNGSQFPKIG